MRPFILLLAFFSTAAAQPKALPESPLRPPAVPLVVHDPYFSVWSMADRLTDENTKHWTGTEQPLASLIRIDGQTFRLMGRDPRTTPALAQQSVEVLPTRTIYQFEGAGIHVNLTFLTPALPRDLDVLSRPLSYIVWNVNATDGKPHEVAIYFDASGALAVDTPDEPVTWARFELPGGMKAMRIGSQRQPVLEKDGDRIRIDWGYLYVSTPPDAHATEYMGNLTAARTAFASAGRLAGGDDTETSAVSSATPRGLAVALPLGAVGVTSVSRHVLIAYDDIWSLTFLERRVRPYWRRNGATAADLLSWGERDLPSLTQRAEAFDLRPDGRICARPAANTSPDDGARLSAIHRRAQTGRGCRWHAAVFPQGELPLTAVSIRWMCFIPVPRSICC